MKFIKLTSYSIPRKTEGGPIYVNLDLAIAIKRAKGDPGQPKGWTAIEFAAIATDADCTVEVVETPEQIFDKYYNQVGP